MTMNFKCNNCKKIRPETTASYTKRTRDLKNIVPFLCRDCLRISHALNPPESLIKARQKRAESKLKKMLHRQSILSVLENPVMRKLYDEEKIKLRKKYRINGAKTRAKRAKAYIPLKDEEKIKIKLLYENCPEGFHVDHIIPISKGGLHVLSNLQYLVASENYIKSNRLDWNLSKCEK